MKEEIKEILDYFRKYMTIDDCIRLNKVEDYITNLQKENEILKKPIVENWEKAHTIKINNPLQDRIDKAIEYIKNIDDEEFINTEHYVEILEILGGDKENE